MKQEFPLSPWTESPAVSFCRNQKNDKPKNKMKREDIEELKKLVNDFEKEVLRIKRFFDKRDNIKFNEAKMNSIKIQNQIGEIV